MKTNRRRFIQTIGTGAAGLGLVNVGSSATAQSDNVSKPAASGRKMVVRADDVGHSKVHNIGTFETIEKGIVTAADVMLESPGTVDALERLKSYPWISIGWHTHMWGSPVLGPGQVPSLVEKGGQFDGRFRVDLGQAEDVVFEEALRELRAQLDRFVKILGKAPDTGGGGRGNSPWARAMNQVTEEFGLVNGFAGQLGSDPQGLEKIKAAQEAGEEWAGYYSTTGFPPREPGEKWAHRKIYMLSSTPCTKELFTNSIAEVEENYDPALFYTEDRGGILKLPEDTIAATAWHPGYVDYYVYRLGERNDRPRARQWVINRLQDVAALCDVRVKDWIKENRIELINFRDALYGTHEYQNYLSLIGSDLAITSQDL